jgi:hypothetical protein
MRTSVKRTLGVGVLGGAAFAAWKAWNARVPQRPRGVEWSTAPFPFPPVPRSSSAPAPAPAAPVRSPEVGWVEPDADGECPSTHPIKAKLGSGIYHLPGGVNYARTKADRCYAEGAAAEADGLRPSKL